MPLPRTLRPPSHSSQCSVVSHSRSAGRPAIAGAVPQPLSPEPEDRLVIQEIPDIFVTGHVHGHHIENYKGVNLVHSSTWQDQTDYQRMLGFQPKPCILTIVNLHTHATAAIPFV